MLHLEPFIFWNNPVKSPLTPKIFPKKYLLHCIQQRKNFSAVFCLLFNILLYYIVGLLSAVVIEMKRILCYTEKEHALNAFKEKWPYGNH